MATVRKKPGKPKGRKRGPPEPPPLVIETNDPLAAFDRLLRAKPDKAKERAKRLGKRR